MNPVYRILQKSIFNGWTTVIGAVMAILYGISGYLTGHVDSSTAFVSISGGITALGLGSKGEKIIQALKKAQSISESLGQ